MENQNLKCLEEQVEWILRTYYNARIDDCCLIYRVVERQYPEIANKSFIYVMKNAKELGINFESITRARRRVQSKFPELIDKETSKARRKNEKSYEEYYMKT